MPICSGVARLIVPVRRTDVPAGKEHFRKQASSQVEALQRNLLSVLRSMMMSEVPFRLHDAIFSVPGGTNVARLVHMIQRRHGIVQLIPTSHETTQPAVVTR